MSFAMRWKHENVRYITWFAIGALVIMFMFLLMLYGTSLKKITIVENGVERTVTTREWQLDRLFEEQSIVIGPHDRLSLPAHNGLKHGDRIVIDHTRPVTIIADGRQRIVHTIGETVSDTIAEIGIELGELDRIEPALYAPLDAGEVVRIVRVQKMVENVEFDLPFEVVTKNDGTLAQGKQKVVQEGKDGVLVETVEKVFEDGKLTSARVLDTTIAAASVDKVVAVGTKKPVTVLSASSPDIRQVTKDGVAFGVKQILTDVTLTSYDAGPASTGKDEDHPQYGITYSGAKVQEGRTIAVDPKVIPLGWWVYIEGYGFRRAEDIGSAIKGKKIDIYFDDASTSGIGRKKGVTVYVIGPKKPEKN